MAAAGLGEERRARDGLMVAIRLQDVASPLRNGGPHQGQAVADGPQTSPARPGSPGWRPARTC